MQFETMDFQTSRQIARMATVDLSLITARNSMRSQINELVPVTSNFSVDFRGLIA